MNIEKRPGTRIDMLLPLASPQNRFTLSASFLLRTFGIFNLSSKNRKFIKKHCIRHIYIMKMFAI